MSNVSHEDDLESLPVNNNASLSFKEKTMFESIYPKTPKKEAREIKAKEAKDVKEVKDIKSTENFIEQEQDAPKERKDREKLSGLKHVVIATFLFFLFQLPFVDNVINRFIKSENLYYKLFLKCFMFALSFFVVNGILSRKY